jgi:hypothetical protein
MAPSGPLRARLLWLFGALLMVTGAVALALCVALLVWHFGAWKNEIVDAAGQLLDQSVRALAPPVPPAWLTARNIALGLGIVGLALVAVGVMIRELQQYVSEKAVREGEDRLRRVHLYREAGWREPYIGPGTVEPREDPRRRRVA